MFVLPSHLSSTGLLAQQKHSVEWIYTCFREIKSFTSYLDLIALIIINRRNRTKTLIGSDHYKIVIPINKSQFENALQISTDFQIAFLEYFGEFHFITLLVSCGISSEILNLLFLTLSAHSLYHRLRFFYIDRTKNAKASFWSLKEYKVFYTKFHSAQQNELYALIYLPTSLPH